jgi:hypothetical protein
MKAMAIGALLSSASLCVCGASALAAVQSASATRTATSIPDFSGIWTRSFKAFSLFDAPPSGPGPVGIDPHYPHGRGTAPWVADLTSPILKPATRAALKKIGEGEKRGDALLKNDTKCLPLGVPAALNVMDQMQMLQAPTQVVILYSRDHQVRFVYLNRPHPKHLKPTWYGDSVGHYEGDTLVIDTVGMNDKTLVDRFGTPHSDQLHMVERYRLSKDRKMLEVSAYFEDPVAFTEPWSAGVTYKHDPANVLEEYVCAENNRTAGDEPKIPIPTAEKPDF